MYLRGRQAKTVPADFPALTPPGNAAVEKHAGLPCYFAAELLQDALLFRNRADNRRHDLRHCRSLRMR